MLAEAIAVQPNQDLILSKDQQSAYDNFLQFLSSPEETFFKITGYAGTGKSTLVSKLISDLPKILSTCELLLPEENWNFDAKLTATTQKAAEALEELTGREASTIQSFLSLRVETDYRTGRTRLIPTNTQSKIYKTVIIMDEYSYGCNTVLNTLNKMCIDCKIVLIGDPYQLLTVNGHCPFIKLECRESKLTQIVRQAEGNPIIELASKFREVVQGGPWFSFKPDNQNIIHLSRPEFDKQVIDVFSDSNWTEKESKILAWRNKKVERYNKGLREIITGSPTFSPNDYAISNTYVKGNNRGGGVKNNETVLIRDMEEVSNYYGLEGWHVSLARRGNFFLPKDVMEAKELIKRYRKSGDYSTSQTLQDTVVDLRASYACTINKAQGSTYNNVFIDLEDLSGCRNPNTLARLLYVAVSRARNQVIMVGDLA